jgi:exodeoxyribonuclease-3
MHASETLRPAANDRAIIVGDLNVAPLECDVWSHKQLLSVVSHTPIECEKLLGVQKAGGWIDAVRAFVPEPTKLFTWWSYRSPDWTKSNKGRRLDHIWTSNMLADRVAAITVAKDYRSAKRPSDHVPVTATLEV